MQVLSLCNVLKVKSKFELAYCSRDQANEIKDIRKTLLEVGETTKQNLIIN